MSGPEVWKHHQGYAEAIEKVKQQSLEEDLRLLDDLFGRDNLRYGDTPETVKQEALRQVEIEWRSERDTQTETALMIAKHIRQQNSL